MTTILMDSQSQSSNSANNNHMIGSNPSVQNISAGSTSQSPNKFEEAERFRQRLEAYRKHHNESSDIHNRTQPIINEQMHDETVKILKSNQVNGAKTKSQKARAPKRQKNSAVVQSNRNNTIANQVNINNNINVNTSNNMNLINNNNGSMTTQMISPSGQMQTHSMNGISPPMMSSQKNPHQQGPIQQITLYPPMLQQQRQQQSPNNIRIHPQQIQPRQPHMQTNQMQIQSVQQQQINYQQTTAHNVFNNSQQPGIRQSVQNPHNQYLGAQHQQSRQVFNQPAQQSNPTHLNRHVDQNHYVSGQHQQTTQQQPQHHAFIHQNPNHHTANGGPQLIHQSTQQTHPHMQQQQISMHHQSQQQEHLQMTKMVQPNIQFQHSIHSFSTLPNDLDFTLETGLECDIDSIINHEMLFGGQLDFNNDLVSKLLNNPF